MEYPIEWKIVDRYMRRYYHVSLEDLNITNVPGYWEDKVPKIHPGHPLHQCLGCEGPFQATYTYFDPERNERGRFASRTRTWKKLWEFEKARRG